MSTKKGLEDLFDEIERRKVRIDRNELTKTLFEYACEYRRYVPDVDLVKVMRIKLYNLLMMADVLYWEQSRPARFILEYPERLINSARKDYQNNLHLIEEKTLQRMLRNK